MIEEAISSILDKNCVETTIYVDGCNRHFSLEVQQNSSRYCFLWRVNDPFVLKDSSCSMRRVEIYGIIKAAEILDRCYQHKVLATGSLQRTTQHGLDFLATWAFEGFENVKSISGSPLTHPDLWRRAFEALRIRDIEFRHYSYSPFVHNVSSLLEFYPSVTNDWNIRKRHTPERKIGTYIPPFFVVQDMTRQGSVTLLAGWKVKDRRESDLCGFNDEDFVRLRVDMFARLVNQRQP